MSFFKVGVVFIMVLVLLELGCVKEKKQKPVKTQKVFYSNGALKAERQYYVEGNDTIPHGYGKLYFRNGKLRVFTNYFEGLEYGLKKGYYPSGNLEYETWYKNGKKDSSEFWYYDVEKKLIMELSNWNNGIEVAEIKEFYKSGNIKSYYYNDYKGTTLYSRQYSERGEVLREEGHGIPVKFIDKNYFKRLDTLVVELDIVSPPKVKRHFYFGVRSDTGDLIDKKEFNLANNTVFTIRRQLKELGQFTFGGLLLLIDQNSGDTAKYEVIVPEIKVQI